MAVAGTQGPIRPNLWADRLLSYAFMVEAEIGRNPMRYLMARGFDHEVPTRAVTMLFVLKPDVLFGTYVRIVEDAAETSCAAHTFLPTMAKPLRVVDSALFDCLPLTDVGYLDLMAWPHPGQAGAFANPAGPDPGEPDPDDQTTVRTYRYGGTLDFPPVQVQETVDRELTMVTGRTIDRDGLRTRSWEITEHGGPEHGRLPQRIRVARPQTGHVTDFLRATAPIPVPWEKLDEKPESLRSWLSERLCPGG